MNSPFRPERNTTVTNNELAVINQRIEQLMFMQQQEASLRLKLEEKLQQETSLRLKLEEKLQQEVCNRLKVEEEMRLLQRQVETKTLTIHLKK